MINANRVSGLQTDHRGLLTLGKLICLCALWFFTMPREVSAQNYEKAIGARVGYPFAVSYKQALGESSMIELYGGYRGYVYGNGFSISGAYQKVYPFDFDDEIDGFNWYWGVGPSVYFWNYGSGLRDRANYSRVSIGLNGYFGLEYTFDDTPISISLDWVPTIRIGSGYYTGFTGLHGGLAVRYVLR